MEKEMSTEGKIFPVPDEWRNRAYINSMEKYKDKSFDPNNPYKDYNEKNIYFNAANNTCLGTFWQTEQFGLAELYYEDMLRIINDYEKKNNCNFNKGMLYANLGISKILKTS